MVGLHGGVEPVQLDLNEIYSRQIHVTGLASVFIDGAHVAGIFDQLRAAVRPRYAHRSGREDMAAREQHRGLPDRDGRVGRNQAGAGAGRQRAVTKSASNIGSGTRHQASAAADRRADLVT